MLKSIWTVRHWNKDRTILLGCSVTENIFTSQGKDFVLDVFLGSTAKPTLYVGIFKSNTTAIVGMTYAVPVYTESSDYSELTRPAWTGGAASSAALSNTLAPAQFTINGSVTVYGGFITNVGTKGDVADVTGKLAFVSKFASPEVMSAAEVLDVTITVSAT
jgi:hypothetical protein